MNEDDKRDAIRLKELGEKPKKIAELFSVSVSTIKNLLAGTQKKLCPQKESTWMDEERAEQEYVERYKKELKLINAEAKKAQTVPFILGDPDPYYNRT